MILVDTSVWIDFFRAAETPQARRLAAALAGDEELCTCGPVMTEVLQGIRSASEYRRVRESLDLLVYLPIGRETYVRAAEIWRKARRRGRTLRSTIDCIIAACAADSGAAVLHRDRDYDTIAELSNLKIAGL